MFRTALIIISFAFSVWYIGYRSEIEDKKRLARYLAHPTYDASVPLGVEPPPKHPRKSGTFSRRKNGCLTSEERQENIEDLEMKGLIDDEGELEQLRY